MGEGTMQGRKLLIEMTIGDIVVSSQVALADVAKSTDPGYVVRHLADELWRLLLDQVVDGVELVGL